MLFATTVAKAFIYVEMFVNVFVIRNLDCVYEQEHGEQAAFFADRMCRSPTMNCSLTLHNGFYELYEKQIHQEWDELGFSPTELRLHGEQRFVCSLPFFYPECLKDEDCVEDLRYALPYWYQLWSGNQDPPCPERLQAYICDFDVTKPVLVGL